MKYEELSFLTIHSDVLPVQVSEGKSSGSPQVAIVSWSDLACQQMRTHPVGFRLLPAPHYAERLTVVLWAPGLNI